MKVELGQFNCLEVLKETSFGLFLDGDDLGEILLPKQYVAEGTREGEFLDVFLYCDSEDRYVATTLSPLAVVGDFAPMKVVDNSPIGTFVDWGLAKDLLIPFAEQSQKMVEGREYLVYVMVNEVSQRIIGSTRLEKFLKFSVPDLEENEEVDLYIYRETDLGYKVIINQSYWGLLYHDEVFKPLSYGQQMKGYVKKIREDQKVDLSLRRPGEDHRSTLADTILKMLKDNRGFLPVCDKTSPKVIYEMFGESKKSFKKALGKLYKERLIRMEKDEIYLIEKGEE